MKMSKNNHKKKTREDDSKTDAQTQPQTRTARCQGSRPNKEKETGQTDAKTNHPVPQNSPTPLNASEPNQRDKKLLAVGA